MLYKPSCLGSSPSLGALVCIACQCTLFRKGQALTASRRLSETPCAALRDGGMPNSPAHGREERDEGGRLSVVPVPSWFTVQAGSPAAGLASLLRRVDGHARAEWSMRDMTGHRSA